jgi:vacuolar-type H+-ATPase catalytic subunit A/Vma1
MDSKVDMHYRFLWDEEPTDEQLQVIMQEVGEEARRENEKIKKQLKEDIEKEYLRLLSTRSRQQ